MWRLVQVTRYMTIKRLGSVHADYDEAKETAKDLNILDEPDEFWQVVRNIWTR